MTDPKQTAEASARFELYYWPGLPGRGEFVRLVLEEAGAEYVDVAQVPESQGGGAPALIRMMKEESGPVPPFAPSPSGRGLG